MGEKKRHRSVSRSRSLSPQRRKHHKSQQSTSSSDHNHTSFVDNKNDSQEFIKIDHEEAERIARIAKLAEERAEKRALERQLNNNETQPSTNQEIPSQLLKPSYKSIPTDTKPVMEKPKFRSKAQRQAEALARLEKQRKQVQEKRQAADIARKQFLQQSNGTNRNTSTSSSTSHRDRDRYPRHEQSNRSGNDKKVSSTSSTSASSSTVQEPEPMDPKILQELKDQYLGKKVKKKKIVKASEKFSKIFQFDWDGSEDTSHDSNPLYAKKLQVNLLYGRGYRAGVDMREQRQKNSFLDALSAKRQREMALADAQNNNLSEKEVKERQNQRQALIMQQKSQEQAKIQALVDQEVQIKGTHWSEKNLEDMKDRDWRIFREDYDITLRGGKAPNPLRSWDEAKSFVPDAVFKAIHAMKFHKPSPIQMQAIPIGVQMRDIIGIAETGSGKTAAFIIPIITYIYNLPNLMIARTGEQGPLALVMAPTRELALQIEVEAKKLCQFTEVGTSKEQIKTLSVVGGQSIEDQAFKLRKGVDIVIGTPGRLMDTLENHYLVLNQCNYVVLDEADRMIDMGFEPQVVAVLENMGSLLKSENEEEMEAQLQRVKNAADSIIAKETVTVPQLFRVTTMFSATMPPEVERLAKTFLRHPAIVKIGDEDSGKNKRIEQRILFIRAGKKRSKLLELLHEILDRSSYSASSSSSAITNQKPKIIVFVNIKKECNSVGTFVQHEGGFRVTILHGGKSQDQREESLGLFRKGVCDILVATDVAGRGLDIPDVTHVINFDLPSKIENYSHRIGRTGRAGRQGIAISMLTDDDEEIMYDLKQYLASTDMPIPPELANHPAAKAAAGARDERGNIIARSKRETTIYAK